MTAAELQRDLVEEMKKLFQGITTENTSGETVPDPGIKPASLISPPLAGSSLPLAPQGKPNIQHDYG